MTSKMRKGIVLLLAMVMMLSASLTASASSPSKQGGTSGGGSSVDTVVGGTVPGATVSVKGIDPMDPQTITNALAATGLKNKGWTMSDAVAFADISAFVNGSAVSAFENGGYITVRLSVPAVKKTSNVAVLHWKANGTVETLGFSVPADGKIDINIGSFSKVAVLVSATASSVGATSPKTGESSMAELAMVIGFIALTGAVVVNRKKAYR